MFDETTGKVTFGEQEQKEIDRIVGERLSREKSKYADYDDVKGVLDELKEFGYEGDAKTVREAIKQQKEALKEAEKRQQQPDAGQEFKQYDEIPSDKVLEALAKKLGMTPEKVEKAIAKSIKDDEAAEAKRIADEAWNKELGEFGEKHADVDVGKLNENDKFLKFIKGKAGSLTTLYEDFLDFIGDAEKEFTEKVKANSERSTSSGREKGSANGSTYGLDEDEISLVDEHNRRYPKIKMTYKEYAESKKH